MLRFRLQELVAEKQFHEGKRVTLTEISSVTGINRVTLSKLINQRGYSTVTDNLDKLCAFFQCEIQDLVQYIPDELAPDQETSKTGLPSKESNETERKQR